MSERKRVPIELIQIDIEAVQWAIALLSIHPGVKANTNSQYWLRRLRKMAGATEDEILKADVDNFLDIYESMPKREVRKP